MPRLVCIALLLLSHGLGDLLASLPGSGEAGALSCCGSSACDCAAMLAAGDASCCPVPWADDAPGCALRAGSCSAPPASPRGWTPAPCLLAEVVELDGPPETGGTSRCGSLAPSPADPRPPIPPPERLFPTTLT